MTTLITTKTEGETELSVADKIANKEIELKQLQLEHEIAVSTQKYKNDAAFDQQNFAREVIQKTLEAGTVDEQIRNLRAYANIGLIEEPYASRILALDEEELPVASLLERIEGDTSYDLPISYFERLIKAARAVGRVEIGGAVSPAARGTGFLVGEGLLVTADHVISDSRSAEGSHVSFDYEAEADGSPSTPARFALAPERLLIVERALGYSLVAVSLRADDTRDLAEFGVISGSPFPGKVVAGDRVNLVHHPRGGPKTVAMREGRIIRIEEDRIHYTSVSSPGSSGAPVLSDHFDLLAIHYARVPRTDDDGKLLKKDGQPWVSGTDSRADIDWIGKEGVRWRSVLADLQARLPDLPPAKADLVKTIKGVAGP